MMFIIIFISLVIERFFHWSHLRQWRWFTVYQRWLSHSRLSRLPAVVLLILSLLPLALVVGIINSLLNGHVYGILKILFGIIVLVYCMGPVNLWVQIYQGMHQLHKEEDPQAAVEWIRNEFGIAPLENTEQFHHAFVRGILLTAYYRVFAVIFWFVILGPVGAVLYRSVALMSLESPLGLMHIAKKIQQLLDWVPVRILTFLFALGGHFTQVFACFKQTVLGGAALNEKMLTTCGMAALDKTEAGVAEKEAIDLFDRALIISLVVLAAMVLVV